MQRLEEPGAERHDDDYAGQLVHGRVVGAFLVALVEALELGEHEPHRKSHEEEENLAARLDPVADRGIEHAHGHCERQSDSERIGRRQGSAYEPAPTPCVAATSRRPSQLRPE